MLMHLLSYYNMCFMVLCVGVCPSSCEACLETEGSSTDDDDDDDDELVDDAVVAYSPRQALHRAVVEWLPDFFVTMAPSYPTLQKPVASVILPPVIPSAVPSMGIPGDNAVSQMAVLELAGACIPPLSPALPTSSLPKLSKSDTVSPVSSSGIDIEPMDCIITPGTTPASVDSAVENSSYSTYDGSDDGSDAVVTCDEVAVADSVLTAETMQVDNEAPVSSVTADDIMTIVDMFYLPFQHGPRAVRLLSDFIDIKLQAADSVASRAMCDSSDQLLSTCCDDSDGRTPETFDGSSKSANWRELVRTFLSRLAWICDIIDRVLAIPNKALAFELFPYLWDIKAALLLLDCFVHWLCESF